MRTLFSYIFILALKFTSVSGQTRIVLDGPNLIDSTINPLILVDSFKTDLYHLVIDTQKIDSLKISKDSTTISQFGEAGKFGVIIIYPNHSAKLLPIAKILNNYKISNDDKKLRICINKTLIQNPQLILIENSEIESVEVTNDIKWTKVERTNSSEKFINIITRKKDKKGL